MDNRWQLTWRRIVALQGEIFRQKRGKRFTYEVQSGAVLPSTTNRLLARKEFEKAFWLMPLDGPGQIQHLQGPSYIWAILHDERVSGGDAPNPRSERTERIHQERLNSASPVPGAVVGRKELRKLGFLRFELEFGEPVELSSGQVGVNWDTRGEVPDAPGLYAFAVEDEREHRITYVGRTSNLWMVTRGQIPRGGARGGQRYGRPKHAGETRKRINVEVAKQIAAGRAVSHWLLPVYDSASLPHMERDLIEKWELRTSGWNRG